MAEKLTEKYFQPHMALKFPGLVLFLSLAVMLIFDQLSWERQFGLQVLILTLLVLTSLLTLVRFEKKHLPWQSYILVLPILFGATMTVFRREISTTTFNLLLMLISAMLLAMTLLNGQWLRYRIREVLMGSLLVILSVVVDPILVFVARIKSHVNLTLEEKHANIKRIWPYARGLLIAMPLLLVLGALLASADLIFKARISNIFDWLKFENLFELTFRATYIAIFAYLLAGVWIHALTRSADKQSIDTDMPIFRPFLGHVEALTVLTLVNLLFLGFIIIQFRYFFAGQANITLEGFTYAEYARRGFFELVAVALISLGMYYLLSMSTKRSGNLEKWFFSALGVLLMAQVGTMLVSAFQRLSLYEAAYGFTTLRTITHIFMVWLGVLLAAAVLMEITNQFKRLALVLFMILLGFTLTLSLLNVDQFIAQRNVTHAIAQHPLDANYLVYRLSDDGIPVLFSFWLAEDTPLDVKDALYATLACKFALRENNTTPSSWVEWHFSRTKAETLFNRQQAELEAYPFITRSQTFPSLENEQEMLFPYVDYFITVNGEEIWCKSVQLSGD